jgi:hypothetical protein
MTSALLTLALGLGAVVLIDLIHRWRSARGMRGTGLALLADVSELRLCSLASASWAA